MKNLKKRKREIFFDWNSTKLKEKKTFLNFLFFSFWIFWNFSHEKKMNFVFQDWWRMNKKWWRNIFHSIFLSLYLKLFFINLNIRNITECMRIKDDCILRWKEFWNEICSFFNFPFSFFSYFLCYSFKWKIW